MSGALLPWGRAQFFSGSGAPLAGGTITTYIQNTTTPKTTYQDQALSIPNANPITLDSAGTCLLWGNGAYRIIVQDASGNTISDSTVYAPATQNADGTLSGNPATNSVEFVTLGQAQADFAALAGSATQTFSAANGTSANEVINWSQVQNTTPVCATQTGVSISTLSTTTSTFTAPSAGLLVVDAWAYNTNAYGNILTATSSLSGLEEIANTGFFGGYGRGLWVLPMSLSQTTTLTVTATTSISTDIEVGIIGIFLPLG